MQLTPYRWLGLTIHSLFGAPHNDLAHVDLAPRKSLEGLLQGRRIERNDFADFGLELPFLRPSNGLLETLDNTRSCLRILEFGIRRISCKVADDHFGPSGFDHR